MVQRVEAIVEQPSSPDGKKKKELEIHEFIPLQPPIAHLAPADTATVEAGHEGSVATFQPE